MGGVMTVRFMGIRPSLLPRFFLPFFFSLGLLFLFVFVPTVPAVSLLDGSFEEIPTPWTQTTNTDCPTWIGNWQPAGGPPAQDGQRYFWSGGACITPPNGRQINSNNAAQTFTLPTNAAELSFWYYAYKAEESVAGNTDQAYIKINNQTVWSYNMTVSGNTGEWVQAVVDIRPYAGQTIQLKLGATQDNDTDFGNVFFDNVQVLTGSINILYLPVIMVNTTNRDSDGEPNNNCQEAFPISTNQPYQFLAQDVDDWYIFHTNTAGDITVELTNFVPIAGQIVLWAGPCQSASFLDHNGDFSTTKIIRVNNQPAGDYIIRIINDGPLNNSNPYSLIIRTR